MWLRSAWCGQSRWRRRAWPLMGSPTWLQFSLSNDTVRALTGINFENRRSLLSILLFSNEFFVILFAVYLFKPEHPEPLAIHKNVSRSRVVSSIFVSNTSPHELKGLKSMLLFINSSQVRNWKLNDRTCVPRSHILETLFCRLFHFSKWNVLYSLRNFVQCSREIRMKVE